MEQNINNKIVPEVGNKDLEYDYQGDEKRDTALSIYLKQYESGKIYDVGRVINEYQNKQEEKIEERYQNDNSQNKETDPSAILQSLEQDPLVNFLISVTQNNNNIEKQFAHDINQNSANDAKLHNSKQDREIQNQQQQVDQRERGKNNILRHLRDPEFEKLAIATYARIAKSIGIFTPFESNQQDVNDLKQRIAEDRSRDNEQDNIGNSQFALIREIEKSITEKRLDKKIAAMEKNATKLDDIDEGKLNAFKKLNEAAVKFDNAKTSQAKQKLLLEYSIDKSIMQEYFQELKKMKVNTPWYNRNKQEFINTQFNKENVSVISSIINQNEKLAKYLEVNEETQKSEKKAEGATFSDKIRSRNGQFTTGMQDTPDTCPPGHQLG